MNITEDEFNKYWKPHIDQAVSLNHGFHLGDARGADTLARDYLTKINYPTDRVKIFALHKSTIKRSNIKFHSGIPVVSTGFPLKTGFNSIQERDQMLTESSCYDISFVRSSESLMKNLGSKFDPNFLTGTQQNINRRKLCSICKHPSHTGIID